MFVSVQFSSVQSLSCVRLLWPHELQHTMLPCPSPTSGAYSSSYPLSQRCHPTISSSVISFSSCLQSLPASGSFPMSQLFTSDGQGIGVSASASVLTMNIQDWMDWLDPLAVQGTLKSSTTPQFKSINSSVLSFLYMTNLDSIFKSRDISFHFTSRTGKLCQTWF